MSKRHKRKLEALAGQTLGNLVIKINEALRAYNSLRETKIHEPILLIEIDN